MIDICGESESYTIDERVYCIPKHKFYGFRLLFVDSGVLCMLDTGSKDGWGGGGGQHCLMLECVR